MAKKIAIISPNFNAYSETFIQAHRNYLDGEIHFLYGGSIPTYSDFINQHILRRFSLLKKATLYMRWKMQSLYKNVLLLALEEYLKKYKIEVILAEYGPTGNAVLNICKQLNLPLIVHFHGYDASVKEVIRKNNQYKNLFKYSDYIVVVSKKMQQMLIDIGAPVDKIVYNVYGPREEFFDVSPNYKSKIFLSIGRFVDKKAPYFTILAFKKVLEKHSDSKLIMVGDGYLLNSCKNIATYFGVEEQIEFKGAIGHKEIKDIMEQACCFVQHSKTAQNGDMEGTPLGILEAQAAGLPAITTLHGGIPDVVINGKTGFLVKEGDVDAMGKSMIKLLEMESLDKMGESSRKRIEVHFNLNKHIKILNQLIKNV